MLLGLVQAAKLCKLADIREGGEECVMSTQAAVEFVNADGGIVSGCFGDIKKFCDNEKLDKFVAVIKSSTPNVLGDLTATLKDLSSTVSCTIHHKVLTNGGYGKAITVGAALILHDASMFSLKQSTHYLNITIRNLVKVFHKDTIPVNGTGVGGSRTIGCTTDLPASYGNGTGVGGNGTIGCTTDLPASYGNGTGVGGSGTVGGKTDLPTSDGHLTIEHVRKLIC
ncbi:hypothetical protein CTI12_AA427770 [Artemisia annua]|uniref:Homologous recombination OB-fold protein OB-fold domain-containing protein n=1 Tax=Artemisia annua TaxID=35608 RepID=A0A2U1LGP6_ARTAN|nr:hypothetical protein CTI12_AA427770 [Artemisia annua]